MEEYSKALEKLEKIEEQSLERLEEISPLEYVESGAVEMESIDSPDMEKRKCTCSGSCGSNYSYGNCHCSGNCGSNYHK